MFVQKICTFNVDGIDCSMVELECFSTNEKYLFLPKQDLSFILISFINLKPVDNVKELSGINNKFISKKLA